MSYDGFVAILIEWTRVSLISNAVRNMGGNTSSKASTNIPEPQTYAGKPDSKEVDNFMFDMEQYFWATTITVEGDKVLHAIMYLREDAKLWWRTKYAEMEAGQCQIDTWEEFKTELNAQFYPENVAFLAMTRLRECTQTGSIREFVRFFSRIMLDITYMSDADRLFSFMMGLKPYARNELNRLRGQTL